MSVFLNKTTIEFIVKFFVFIYKESNDHIHFNLNNCPMHSSHHMWMLALEILMVMCIHLYIYIYIVEYIRNLIANDSVFVCI